MTVTRERLIYYIIICVLCARRIENDSYKKSFFAYCIVDLISLPVRFCIQPQCVYETVVRGNGLKLMCAYVQTSLWVVNMLLLQNIWHSRDGTIKLRHYILVYVRTMALLRFACKSESVLDCRTDNIGSIENEESRAFV